MSFPDGGAPRAGKESGRPPAVVSRGDDLGKGAGRHWRRASRLAAFTILYNLAEGLVSVHFGIQDEALALFGFGVDSFIEVLSGAGILVMVRRIRRDAAGQRSRFERAALRVTGMAFFLLAAGLTLSAVYNLAAARKPETTLPGLIIASVSLAVMWALVLAKRRTGRALQSPPILADANCTLACMYMSLVLLASSLLFHLTGLGFADVLGAAGLVYFSIHEGLEAFAKARGLECGCAAECGGPEAGRNEACRE